MRCRRLPTSDDLNVRERHLNTRPVAMQQTNSGIFRCYFEFLVTLRRYATGEVEYRSSRRHFIKIAEKEEPPHRGHTHDSSVFCRRDVVTLPIKAPKPAHKRQE